MTTIGLLFLGQFLVVGDLRAGSVDVLPDPIGWAVTAVALIRLRHHSSLFTWAAGLTVVAGVLSLVDWVYALERISISTTTVSMMDVDDLFNAGGVYDLAILAILELTTLGLRAAAVRAGDTRAARQFTAIAVALIAVEVVATVGATLVILGVVTMSLALVATIFSLVALIVHAWWVFLLFTHRHAPWGHHALTPAEMSVLQPSSRSANLAV